MSRNDVIGCVKRRALELLHALAVGAVMVVGFYAFAALGNAAGLNDGGVSVEEACKPGKGCTLGEM